MKRERRQTCAAHLGFVARHYCIAPGCRRHPVEVHHVRVPGTDAAAGRRSSDRFTLPLCAEHHRGDSGVHGRLGEVATFRKWGIEPLSLCRELVRRSVATGFAPAEWLQVAV